MAENTAISWADDTFNPWEGCQKVSPACDGCYAEALMDTRYGKVKWGPHGERVRTAPANWAKPLKWEREEARKWEAYRSVKLVEPPPRFVFCASLADVFDNAVPVEWRSDLFNLIRKTPHLTWLLLTKRPGSIVKLFAEAITPELRTKWSQQVRLGESLWPRNAAIGCTVVTQEEADRDIPRLLAAKAGLNPAFAFVSMEPLLGPVDLDTAWHGETALDAECWGDCAWCSKGHPPLHNCARGRGDWEAGQSGLDWVITGGETDQGQHKARPSHPDWFRSLRDQSTAAGVPFHFKQWGEWVGGEVYSEGKTGGLARHQAPSETAWGGYPDYWWDGDAFGGVISTRVGKKAAGRALDGVIHDARPSVT